MQPLVELAVFPVEKLSQRPREAVGVCMVTSYTSSSAFVTAQKTPAATNFYRSVEVLLPRLEAAVNALASKYGDRQPLLQLADNLKELTATINQQLCWPIGSRARLRVALETLNYSGEARRLAGEPLKEAINAAELTDKRITKEGGEELFEALRSEPSLPVDGHKVDAILDRLKPTLKDVALNSLSSDARRLARKLVAAAPAIGARVAAPDANFSDSPTGAALTVPSYPGLHIVEKRNKVERRSSANAGTLARDTSYCPKNELLRTAQLFIGDVRISDISNTCESGSDGKVRVGTNTSSIGPMGPVAFKEIRRLGVPEGRMEATPDIHVIVEVAFMRMMWGDSLPLLHLVMPKANLIMMPLMDRGDLRMFASSLHSLETPMPSEAMENLYYEMAVPLSAQLQNFHQRSGNSIVRDIKPGNIFLDSQRGPVLADLGSVTSPDPGESKVVSSCFGTPGYSAPEVYMGIPVSSRVDVFSLSRALTALLVPNAEDIFSQLGFHDFYYLSRHQIEMRNMQDYQSWHERQPRDLAGNIVLEGKEPNNPFTIYFKKLSRWPAICSATLNGLQHPDPTKRWDDDTFVKWAAQQRHDSGFSGSVLQTLATGEGPYAAVLHDMQAPNK